MMKYITLTSKWTRWRLKSPVSRLFTHRWPANYPHKWPVTRKMFPFDDVIINGSLITCPKDGHCPHRDNFFLLTDTEKQNRPHLCVTTKWTGLGLLYADSFISPLRFFIFQKYLLCSLNHCRRWKWGKYRNGGNLVCYPHHWTKKRKTQFVISCGGINSGWTVSVFKLTETTNQMITSYAPSHDLIWNNIFRHNQSNVVGTPISDNVYNVTPTYLKIKCTKFQDAYKLLFSNTSIHTSFVHLINKSPTVLWQKT